MNLKRPLWRATTPSGVDDELGQHLEMLTLRYMQTGLSREEARAKAADRFGELNRVREECHDLAHQMEHDVKRTEYFEELKQDVAYAVRMLRRAPSFTVIAILTLALGIGANTAIFSVVRSVLLRPLPYEHPEQLVQLWTDHRALGRDQPEWLTPPEFQDWRAQNTTFAGMAAYQGGAGVITGDGDPETLPGFFVSGDFFDVLGVSAGRGRLLTMADDNAGAEPVAVISDALWRRRFGSDSAILGKRLTLNGNPWTVVGVLPPSFRAPLPAPADIFRPARRPANSGCGRTCIVLRAVGRMKPGVTFEQARADLGAVAARLAAQYPESNAKVGAWLVPLHEQISGPTEVPLYAIGGSVALVLLIACVNIANLLISRVSSRARELAVRAALGAGDGRILRQLMTENVLLAVVGGVLGVAVGIAGSSALASLVPDGIRAVQEIRIDGTVFAFSIALTLVSATVFGLLPALRATRANSHLWLRGGAQELGGGRGRLRGSLVVAQVSLAVVLLVGAGLLLRSFLLMQQVDLGYRDRGVFLAGVVFPASRYSTPNEVLGAVNGTLDRLRASAAVKSAEATDLPPLLGGGDQDITAIPVGEVMTGGEPPSIWYRGVTSGYLATMQMRLIAGRDFTPADRSGAPKVAIVNADAAAGFWHGNDPVGRQLSTGNAPEAPKVTIIGVVASGKHNGPNQPTKAELFLPLEQFPARGVTFVVEPKADHQSAVAALRDALKATDPLIPIPVVNDIDALVGTAVSLPRLYATLVGIFAGAALLLAVLGVYGVMAFRVAQRQREIGVRLALGAAPTRILGMILGEGGRLAVLGVVIGFVAALALGRSVNALLFGVKPFDVTTFVVAAVVLGLMTLAAAFIPARRAMRVDPITTIRGD